MDVTKQNGGNHARNESHDRKTGSCRRILNLTASDEIV